jgi:hypothetical protein
MNEQHPIHTGPNNRPELFFFFYLGLLYTMVEKWTGRSKISAQDMDVWGKGWYAREDLKTKKNVLRSLDRP